MSANGKVFTETSAHFSRRYAISSYDGTLDMIAMQDNGDFDAYKLSEFAIGPFDITFASEIVNLQAQKNSSTYQFTPTYEIAPYNANIYTTKQKNLGRNDDHHAVYARMIPATPPPAIVAQVRATPTPCPTFASGLVTFGIDQSATVVVEQTQSFMLAMRGGAGESFLLPYQMRVTPSGPIVTYVRPFTISDATFSNADRSPGSPYVADGPATQYFLFTATGVGTTTVTFDEFEIGHMTTPYATKTFTIVVTAPKLTC